MAEEHSYSSHRGPVNPIILSSTSYFCAEFIPNLHPIKHPHPHSQLCYLLTCLHIISDFKYCLTIYSGIELPSFSLLLYRIFAFIPLGPKTHKLNLICLENEYLLNSQYSYVTVGSSSWVYKPKWSN